MQDPEYRMMVINQMFKETPLIDGWVCWSRFTLHSGLRKQIISTLFSHNDLPWNIRQFIHNKLKTVNFSSDLTQVSPWATSKWSHTDLPRIIKGRLGAQVSKMHFRHLSPSHWLLFKQRQKSQIFILLALIITDF